MIPYPKIESLLVRDTETYNLIEGQWRLPEFEYLKDNLWGFEEKLHGTNVRVVFDYVTSPFGLGGIPVPSVEFKGRTDKAQMPTFLFDKLTELFPVEKLQECFGVQPVTLYGEGFGNRIQSLGSSYIPDGVDFALFDIRIGDWWLKREDVKAIAKTLGITTTPVVGKGTLEEAIAMAKEGFNSQWGDFRAEGLVVRPAVPLQMRNGKRIIGKVKYGDFHKERRNGKTNI